VGVERLRATLFVVDDDGCVLMFRGGDPARPEDGTWWFPPGGGVEVDETIEAAGRRELHEETGLVVTELGPVVHVRATEFSFLGVEYDAVEHCFLVRAPRFEVNRAGWSDVERAALHEHRWWSRAELTKSNEVVHPADLVDLLDELAV
jgi:8-oxo-dGTP pyrophosphatase MutT (NUDIX family)